MSVQNITRRAGPYVGTGLASAYTFAFKVFRSEDVKVVRSASSDASAQDETLKLGTDYTVKLNANQDEKAGGTVTLVSPLAEGLRLSILSAITPDQQMVLTNHDGMLPTTLNDSADKAIALIQELQELLGRGITVPATSAMSPAELLNELVSAAKDARFSAEEAQRFAEICEEIKQNIFIYSWDIPHVVDTLEDVANYPYDGFFAVGGYGDPGHHGQDISNRVVKARGSTELRTLGEWAGDIFKSKEKLATFISVKDFGAKGDGVTDDTGAFDAASKESDILFVPQGAYPLTGVPEFSKLFGYGVLRIGDQLLPVSDVYTPLKIAYPGAFKSLEDIFTYLSYRRLHAPVTIVVSEGTFDIAYQITHTHPDGKQIRLTGAGTDLTVLRFTLPSASGKAGVYISGNYDFGLISNLTLDGNSLAGFTGGSPETADGNAKDPVGVFASYGATITLDASVKVRKFARNGIFAAFGGTINAAGTTVEGTGSDAFVASQNGQVNATGAHALRNYGAGVFADYGGTIWADGVEVVGTQKRNGVSGVGIEAANAGVVMAMESSVSDTAGHGMAASYAALIYAEKASITRAGRAGILARTGATVLARAANVSESATNGIQATEASCINAADVTSCGNGADGVRADRSGTVILGGSTRLDGNAEYGIRTLQEGKVIASGLSLREIAKDNVKGTHSGTVVADSGLTHSRIYAQE